MRVNLYVGPKNLVQIRNLRDQATNALVPDKADITVSVLDGPAGSALTGADKVAMTYVASSGGTYQAILPSTVPMTVGSDYWVKIVDSETDPNLHILAKVTAQRYPGG